ncbi:DUF302 domain-containing protein [Isoptericola sp. b441]|uniref:DUF302 domain-containing protein n=1 Tax=Actinotalea lenta TaxID=3064654 RepID=A0ABT9D987_9CELL|nr:MULTISPECIES: DUF302 domain-containing protein [unclassified Isoptericola]MDO8105866.1 DUF302 domain-containing protein [Isoptericola sp. b441]MDO8122581.1 DUF302 domain-containing protein [Isoptericola sp. b490]
MQFERTVDVALPFEDAVTRTREALASQGFGILTEIDMEATLRAKRQVEIGPYVILGACNPALAEGAVTADPRIGVLLPCSVVVRATGPDSCQVHVFDPALISTVTDVDGLTDYADEAGARIGRALAELAEA